MRTVRRRENESGALMMAARVVVPMSGDARPVCPQCGAPLFQRHHGDLACVQHGLFYSAQVLDETFGAGTAQVGEGADQRERDGHAGDAGRPGAAEEEEHHQHHQGDGDDGALEEQSLGYQRLRREALEAEIDRLREEAAKPTGKLYLISDAMPTALRAWRPASHASRGPG